jgi:hypothetical protein
VLPKHVFCPFCDGSNSIIRQYFLDLQPDSPDIIYQSFVQYELILDAAGLVADTFPVIFVCHERDARPTGADVISHLFRTMSSIVRPKFPLALSLTVKPVEATHELTIHIDYDWSKLSAATVQALCDRFLTLVGSPKEREDAIVGQLAALTEDQETSRTDHCSNTWKAFAVRRP